MAQILHLLILTLQQVPTIVCWVLSLGGIETKKIHKFHNQFLRNG